MGASQVNPYIWPTLAQGGTLGMLGLYGLIHWRKAPRLALAGLVALTLLGFFGTHLYCMTAEPMLFIQERSGIFKVYIAIFSQLLIGAMGFQLISSFLHENRMQVTLVACSIGLIALYLINIVGLIRVHESFGIVDVVIADYGRMGKIPIPIFWGTRNLFVGIMVAFPILVLISSSRVLFQNARDWLRFSPWTIISGMVVFTISLFQLYVRKSGADFTGLMELMQLSFYIALFAWVAAFQKELIPGSLQLRQILGGVAIGLFGSVLTHLFIIPFTYAHVNNLWIAAIVSLFAICISGIILYYSLFIRYEAELEASRQERLAAIGRLASVTAHEIRNPLQAIRSLSQLIAAKVRNSDLQEPAEVIMQETDRLDAILKRLLDFSRELKLTLKEVPLIDWWNEIRSIAKEMAGASDIECIWSAPPDETVLFDSEKIRQVFINIFKNAMEASSPGGVIHSSLDLVKGVLVLRVEDQGPGISPEDAEKVFREFFTTKSEGSGLGLPVSRRILEAHGGKIYFDLKVSQALLLLLNGRNNHPVLYYGDPNLTRYSNIIGVVILGLAILSPLMQLFLICPYNDLRTLRREVKNDWIDENNRLSEDEYIIIDRTLNPEIVGTDLEFYESGIPKGRSYPPMSSGFGPNVVIDHKVKQAEEDPVNTFWSFWRDHFPVELIIKKENVQEDDGDTYNWICVIPRSYWQIALRLDILIPLSESQEEWRPEQVVPMHYQGPRPVVYHFSQEEGIGVRMVIQDAKIAENNSWWAPIYEVGAGWCNEE